MPSRRRTARAATLTLLASLALTAWSELKPADLTNLSIEDLMNIQVTSVSKTEQMLSRAASAILVITPDAIRRSGATNIPDLLRMVPGLDVAQINANTWAVSVRGFNARFSNELLVLMDGRTVYTPTFGGVFWDVLDLPLGNVERIEVIRQKEIALVPIVRLHAAIQSHFRAIPGPRISLRLRLVPRSSFERFQRLAGSSETERCRHAGVLSPLEDDDNILTFLLQTLGAAALALPNGGEGDMGHTGGNLLIATSGRWTVV